MRARRYDKRVGIYTVSTQSDGFGGVIEDQETLSETRWAMVKTPSQASIGQLRENYGLEEVDDVKRFIFRSFSFNQAASYLSYNGAKYRPLATQDRDEYGTDLEIIAIKE